jgi:hypothetical protein
MGFITCYLNIPLLNLYSSLLLTINVITNLKSNTNLKPTGGKRHMTETNGDKSLRGVAEGDSVV